MSTRATALVGTRANLTLIERPLRAVTLVATVKAALRARSRQYEIRDLLKDRETLLASLEERVAERTSSLRQMVEELEAFSYSVSHDLRAPLRVLDGYARALLEDYSEKLEPAAKDMLTRIARTAHRMDRLTQDLLAYTRVSRGEITLEPVDVEQMLRAVIEQYPYLIASSPPHPPADSAWRGARPRTLADPVFFEFIGERVEVCAQRRRAAGGDLCAAARKPHSRDGGRSRHGHRSHAAAADFRNV